ncbi:MAG: glucose-6-phosphate dehydrogenase, partial [Candidatus Nealsonbacteria bacterium]|nr:glucose-6-phosphate dehydrogenase [Candidatus Nealsonbacteria bacterium]
LTLATMEEPKGQSEGALHRERLKLIKSLVSKSNDLVLGQYDSYKKEEFVDKNSATDSFFALKLSINNARFRGVPVYIRAGKQMAAWVTEINYVFKSEKLNDNVLTIRLQPNEGIAVKLLTKKPGFTATLEPTYMQFCYKHFFPNETFDAYEKLLQDVFAGHHTFFNTAKEVEALWRFIDPLSNKRPKTVFYKDGSWGPKEADRLIERDGRRWLAPYHAFCQI